MVTPIEVEEEEDEYYQRQQQNRVFYQLCGMMINILGSPLLPIPFPTLFAAASPSSSSRSQVSPAAFASLFLGISLALMVFGSVIFVIGFILMPWVVALVFLFYFAALLSNLSHFCRAFLSPPSSSSSKAWKIK